MDGISHVPVSSYKAVILSSFNNSNNKKSKERKVEALLLF